MLSGQLALIIAALFGGAAFYVSFAEPPARLGLDDRALLAEWKPSYKRGTMMQATLAVLGLVVGVVAWLQTGPIAFLIGALFMLANVLWTLIAILPTDNLLMATDLDQAGRGRALIVKWDRLHSVRRALGILAILAFLSALL